MSIKRVEGNNGIAAVNPTASPARGDEAPAPLRAPNAGTDGPGRRYASEARATPTPGPLRAYEAHRMIDANEAALLAASTANPRQTAPGALLAAMACGLQNAMALEYLEQRFTPRTDDTIVDAADFPDLLKTSFDTLAAGGEAAMSAFTERVLFNFEDRGDYRHVADFVARNISPASIAHQLLARIEGDNPLHVRNAAALAYNTLGYGVTLPAKVLETLDLARMTRLMDNALHPMARAALEDMRLPY
jgi:predicted outer membrane lipoprotein